MEDFRLNNIIEEYIKEICHFSQMQVFSTSYYQKKYFQSQIKERISALTRDIEQYYKENMLLSTQRGEDGVPKESQAKDADSRSDMGADTEATGETESQTDKKADTKANTKVEGRRVFTLEELAQYNGKDGERTLVAINGIVYDVSRLESWKHGLHLGLRAGKDLTSEFMSCHRGNQLVLKDIPVVGILKR